VVTAALLGTTLGHADTRDADLVKQGTDALKRSEYDVAIARFSDAIRLAPEDADAWGKRCEAYASKGDHDRALADCTQAIKLAPSSGAAYHRLGDVYYIENDFKRAIAEYDTTIRLDPRGAPAYASRGSAYYHLEQFDRAISDFDQALRFDPSLSNIYTLRGNTWFLKGDFDRAQDDYNRGIKANPRNAYAYLCRGRAASLRGHLDDAIADYNRAISVDPSYKDAYRYRDSALQNQGFRRWGKIDLVLFGVAILAIFLAAFRAGLFDSYYERSSKKLRDGRLAFYPYLVGRGYIVSAEQKATLIRYMLAATICGALLVPLADILGLRMHIVLVISLFGLGYYGGMWWQTSDFERAPADERLTLGERYRTRAHQFGWIRLWFIEIFSGSLIAIGLHTAATGMGASDRLLGLAATAFFGLMAWSGAYMLWVKSSERQ